MNEWVPFKIENQSYLAICFKAIGWLGFSRSFYYVKNGLDLFEMVFCYLNLFWPSDREKLLEFEAEDREFAKFLEQWELKFEKIVGI